MIILFTGCDKKELEFKEAYYFSEGLAQVKIDDYYGYIDEKLDLVIPNIYEDAGPFMLGKSPVKKDGYYGIITIGNEVLLPFEYEALYLDYNGTDNVNIHLKKDGKWGIMDKDFNLIVPFEYDHIESRSNDYTAVFKNANYGLVNQQGELVVEPKYSSIFVDYLSFGENRSPVFITQTAMNYGYIYPGKNIIVEPIYQSIRPSWGSEILIICKDNKYGFINLSNGVTVEPKYDTDFTFSSEGLAAVSENGNAKYIDTEGTELFTDLKLTSANPFFNGLALINGGKGYGYIDTAGNTVIPGPFTEAQNFQNGFALVKQGNLYGVINTKGEYICEPRFTNIQTNYATNTNDTIFITSYSNGSDTNTACYSYDGQLLFDTIYNKIELFNYNGLNYGIVLENGKYGCINERGIEIIPLEYVKLSPAFTAEGLFIAINSDFKHGLIDNMANEILPFEYDSIVTTGTNIYVIKADNKYGFFNIETKKIIEPIYDEVLNYYDTNIIIVRKDGNYIYLDKNGIPLK